MPATGGNGHFFVQSWCAKHFDCKVRLACGAHGRVEAHWPRRRGTTANVDLSNSCQKAAPWTARSEALDELNEDNVKESRNTAGYAGARKSSSKKGGGKKQSQRREAAAAVPVRSCRLVHFQMIRFASEEDEGEVATG